MKSCVFELVNLMGKIFNIQKFSINDGPGIRTTVFLKGCPLDCIWCHNPESKSRNPQILYNESKCIGCKACEAVCPEKCHGFSDNTHLFNREKCISCGKCADVCASNALELCGYEISADEVISKVMQDKTFYDNSGGGMTLSGGEPMAQFEFALELMIKAKEQGLHTCMETCGAASEDKYKKIAEFTDIFLYDYKITNSDEHKKYTGISNELILSNLKMLDILGKSVILRCPIIPGINDNDAHLSAIAKLANELSNISEINVEPYHPLGKGKSEELGVDYLLEELTFPEEGEVLNWIEKIQKQTSIPDKKA